MPRPAELVLTIPQVRDGLLALAEGLGGFEELEYLANQLWRRPAVRQARRTNLNVDWRGIIDHAAAYPDDSYMEIANRFGTTIGRVSEALSGKRGE